MRRVAFGGIADKAEDSDASDQRPPGQASADVNMPPAARRGARAGVVRARTLRCNINNKRWYIELIT